MALKCLCAWRADAAAEIPSARQKGTQGETRVFQLGHRMAATQPHLRIQSNGQQDAFAKRKST